MKNRFRMAVMGVFLFAAPALAQQKTVSGKVTDEQNSPLAGVSVVIKGTTLGTQTSGTGNYSIRVTEGQVLQFRFIGTAPAERTVGTSNAINVALHRTATSLDAVVVTALGQTTAQRSLGTAQQSVAGPEIAQTQRENFVNALQGRIAGVQVTSTSGTPGASSSIIIRGVSSISGNNQPLMIVDGLPIDNKTLNSNVLASDAPGSGNAFNNRGVDFTNRSADINPEDIESLVVLKGPEAAALYGIDAANGAIVITTKRGRVGGGLEYSNSFRAERTGRSPDVQRTYSLSPTSTTYNYFGAPYADNTPFFNNISGFFRTAFTQKHSLSFSGAASDRPLNYRIAGATTRQQGVIPGTQYARTNLTGASQAQVTRWLSADLSMAYSNQNNDQVYKGDNGPLLGLLVYPATLDAASYLTPAGTRLRFTTLAAGGAEIDNPYFSVNKNKINSKNNRIISNLGLTITPFGWGNIKSTLGADYYTNQNLLLRHPESALGFSAGGIIDVADDVTRNLNVQNLLNFNSHKITGDLSVSGLIGNAISDLLSNVDATQGTQFLDPNFVSINNTNISSGRSSISQRRLIGAFAQAVFDYKNYLYVTLQGRNDWTSTIPKDRNSFLYPSITSSFVFTDAFPSLGQHMTGKLRAAYAQVGKDARPYAYNSFLEKKTTANGGFGYGFTGPNPNLRPEFAKSYEVGTELSFLDDRLGIDATVYRKQTTDQIVNDVRGSYATGFILLNVNGAATRNQGLEVTVRGTPVRRSDFSWDVLANFESSRAKVLALPHDLPESYVSDTWLYANVRNGSAPNLSIMSLTGLYYLRNTAGQLLIDPTSGLPIRSASFIDAGYDRQPNFTVGLNNTVRYGRFSVSALLDMRRGGDVFNATQHYLTTKGLAVSTLDRNTPRVIPGVLRDGKENSSNPTVNGVVVIPSVQTGY